MTSLVILIAFIAVAFELACLLSSSGTKWITHVTVLTAELARLFQREM
jgi:hypothetical protein